MTTITVAIVGLGRYGASAALALKRYSAGKGAQHQFDVIAYDPREDVQSAAAKNGVVTNLARHAIEAVRNREIVILDLPYSLVQTVYRDIGREMRPGGVLLDFSPLTAPSLVWAAKHVREDAYMVSVTPVVNPAYLFDGLDDIDHARADLFDGGTLLLMPSPKCAKEAVELAADLSVLLGATPHFVDPHEHDALVASTESLPALLGVALFTMMKNAPSWDDSQRVTNPNFGRLTHHLHDTHPDDLRDLLLNNRQNLVHSLDSLMRTLVQFRAVLEAGDQAAMEAALIDSATAYSQWLSRRQKGKWDASTEMPRDNAGIMSAMMGSYLAKRMRGGKDEE